MNIEVAIYTAGAMILALLGVFAFRVVATFDFNKWQERKDQKLLVRLQNACRHVSVADAGGGKRLVTPLFITTFGTTDWFCTRCQRVFPGGLLLPSVPKDSIGINAAMQLEERYVKLARKAG